MTPPRQSPQLPRFARGSLTEQATSTLLDAILNHRFPDRRLPAETELATELGVSRTTVRSALMTLERLGVVGRKPSLGTRVRAHVGRESIILQRLIGFFDLLTEKYEQVEVSQRYWLEEHPSERAVQQLGISENTAVIRTAKTLTADGHPAIFITDTIPLSHCSGTDQAKLRSQQQPEIPDSIFEFSHSWTVNPIDHTVITLTPAVAPVDQSTLLLEDGTPFMRMFETHYQFDGTAVALSEVHADSRYVELSVVRHG